MQFCTLCGRKETAALEKAEPVETDRSLRAGNFDGQGTFCFKLKEFRLCSSGDVFQLRI